ncbi:glycosyltransferase family 4 protein [Kordiimonas aquimaris]|uniref:glycosyltransferase family 4 protein n=1 Tax=Kordiimonas aquimaris TaxID=707591 RepID=UPI0021CFCF2D|nr:glycosyltransferase family 1 protein [Kordiimonas aquimaris]
MIHSHSFADNLKSTTISPKDKKLRICLITDAWHPQVNGVVRTLDSLRRELRTEGHRVLMITPNRFKTIACPTYPEIRLAINTMFRMSAFLRKFKPDAIHIATEGPLGWAARRWCVRNNVSFTTAYHTAFPEYIEARTRLSANIFYPIFRHFHSRSAGVLVATPTVSNMLHKRGFANLMPWTRGVDTSLFRPRSFKPNTTRSTQNKPTLLYVGRVAVEKNIEAFLTCKTHGTKVVVGDGPAFNKLKAAHPDVDFLGAKFGTELAQLYADADVFVFPSKTDTFGLVMIEALAAGTPVAAYPVQGPVDVLGPTGQGPQTKHFANWSTPIAGLDKDLSVAIEEALKIDRAACRDFAHYYNWKTVSQQFLGALQVQA